MTGNLHSLCQNVKKANKSMSFKALITEKTNSSRNPYVRVITLIIILDNTMIRT